MATSGNKSIKLCTTESKATYKGLYMPIQTEFSNPDMPLKYSQQIYFN